jgi:RimJ/RimL family protein N-acetyltransferase
MTDGVVTLRPLAAEDASEWLAGEDEEQLRWFEAPHPAEFSDVRQFISECQKSWRELGGHRHWGIRNVDSSVLLGGVDLRSLDSRRVNLSYVVFPPFRRHGVARRASILALNYASTTMGATTAIIKMLPGNVSSHKLALSLGAHFVRDETPEGGKTFRVLEVDLPLG